MVHSLLVGSCKIKHLVTGRLGAFLFFEFISMLFLWEEYRNISAHAYIFVMLSVAVMAYFLDWDIVFNLKPLSILLEP